MTSPFSSLQNLTGFKKGPSPAKIYIQVQLTEELQPFMHLQGFQRVPGGLASKIAKTFKKGDLRPTYLKIQIPVTPPTIEMDFGNTNDSQNVARVGEVVLPKFKKAQQFRWESFFPYDIDAPYLATRMNGGSWITSFKNARDNVANAFSNVLSRPPSKQVLFDNALKDIRRGPAAPNDYVKLFKYLSAKQIPVKLSMTFYDGGQLEPIDVTLETFKSHPDTAGDYNYSISLVEYTDISPKKLNEQGEPVEESSWEVMSKVVKDVKDPKVSKFDAMMKFFNKVKNAYGVVSKSLVWAMAQVSGVRHLFNVADNEIWKIYGSFNKLAPKFGARANLISQHKITPKDTRTISLKLKENTYVDASDRLAQFMESYRK